MASTAAAKILTATTEDKISKNGWVRLAVVKSSSNPTAGYNIGRRRTKNGIETGCSCKGWIFHRKCKHLTAFLAGSIPSHAIDYTPAGVALLSAERATSATRRSATVAA